MTAFKTLFLSLFILCPIASAMAQDDVAKFYQSGVSVELAQKRKAEITNVKYTLSFHIPEAKETPIKGEELISFFWRNKISDLVIDFKADLSQIKHIAVNGESVKFTFKQEHIILAASLFSKGQNSINISFVAGDKSLNRNNDYLYTLFVPDHARQAFPCFDQPDLKARFTLSLQVPQDWETVANSKQQKESINGDCKTISFQETEQIPTYLFAFVAGKFKKASCSRYRRTVCAYYRETNPKKTAQLPIIFNQVFSSIKWMEEYTGIAYPFAKYDLVILPGFQFGGMEHVGAILYNDKRMFISEHPTPDEELNRAELIAHETAHDWFGDMVTMKWFNDVWTKEVFANYMASKIARQQFPLINHDLNFLKSYSIYAMADDRTSGTHPIQQPLDNLQNAGLLYGNIIYDKAPVMMRKLEQQMGSDAFRKGLQKYLRSYAFSNADWDDLIDILDKENPKAKLKAFSNVWVKQKGMPDILVKCLKKKLTITQKDPYGRGCVWQQHFKMATMNNGTIQQVVDVNMQNNSVTIPLERTYDAIIPNYDGMGYGRFIVDSNNAKNLLRQWTKGKDVNREAILMSIYENFLMHQTDADECAKSLLNGLATEKNALIASTCCNYLSTVAFYQKGKARQYTEQKMWEMSIDHAIPSCRQKLIRALFSLASDSTIVDHLYQVWNTQGNQSLNEDDYMSLSYQLALRKPSEWQTILNKERARISSTDRRREFDFISRGCTPDEAEQSRLFESLLQKENRTIEPWTERLLSLLNSPLREPACNRFITPGLNVLQEIQRTGDIFFPKGWVSSLLSGHQSKEAQNLVKEFLASHPDYPQALKNKLLQAAYYLLNF